MFGGFYNYPIYPTKQTIITQNENKNQNYYAHSKVKQTKDKEIENKIEQELLKINIKFLKNKNCNSKIPLSQYCQGACIQKIEKLAAKKNCNSFILTEEILRMKKQDKETLEQLQKLYIIYSMIIENHSKIANKEKLIKFIFNKSIKEQIKNYFQNSENDCLISNFKDVVSKIENETKIPESVYNVSKKSVMNKKNNEQKNSYEENIKKYNEDLKEKLKEYEDKLRRLNKEVQELSNNQNFLRKDTNTPQNNENNSILNDIYSFINKKNLSNSQIENLKKQNKDKFGNTPNNSNTPTPQHPNKVIDGQNKIYYENTLNKLIKDNYISDKNNSNTNTPQNPYTKTDLLKKFFNNTKGSLYAKLNKNSNIFDLQKNGLIILLVGDFDYKDLLQNGIFVVLNDDSKKILRETNFCTGFDDDSSSNTPTPQNPYTNTELLKKLLNNTKGSLYTKLNKNSNIFDLQKNGLIILLVGDFDYKDLLQNGIFVVLNDGSKENLRETNFCTGFDDDSSSNTKNPQDSSKKTDLLKKLFNNTKGSLYTKLNKNSNIFDLQKNGLSNMLLIDISDFKNLLQNGIFVVLNDDSKENLRKPNFCTGFDDDSSSNTNTPQNSYTKTDEQNKKVIILDDASRETPKKINFGTISDNNNSNIKTSQNPNKEIDEQNKNYYKNTLNEMLKYNINSQNNNFNRNNMKNNSYSYNQNKCNNYKNINFNNNINNNINYYSNNQIKNNNINNIFNYYSNNQNQNIFNRNNMKNNSYSYNQNQKRL